MTARIYMPANTAMQSGFANTKDWLLDFEPESAGDRAADGLDLVRRHAPAGAPAFFHQGGGDRLLRAQWHCLSAVRSQAAHATRAFLFRQIRLQAPTPGPTEIAPTSALLRGFEFVMREDRKCANVCWG